MNRTKLLALTKRNHWLVRLRTAMACVLLVTLFGAPVAHGSQIGYEYKCFEKGNRLLDSQEYQEALVWYQKVIDMESSNSNSPLLAGTIFGVWRCHEGLGNQAEAAAWHAYVTGKSPFPAMPALAEPLVESAKPAPPALAKPDMVPAPAKPAVRPRQKKYNNDVKEVTKVTVVNMFNTPQIKAMINAIENGNANEVKQLIDSGFDINTVMCCSSDTGQYLINTLQCERRVYQEYTGCRNMWTVWHPDYPHVFGELYGTPLMLACRMRNPVMVRQLLDWGANPNVWIKFGMPGKKGVVSRPYVLVHSFLTPLLAGKDKWGKRDIDKLAEINDLLKEAGATFPGGVDDFGRTALWDAFESGNAYWLKFLLENTNLDPKQCDNGGNSFLDFIATLNLQHPLTRAMIKILEEHGYELPKDDSADDEPDDAGKDAKGVEIIEVK